MPISPIDHRHDFDKHSRAQIPKLRGRHPSICFESAVFFHRRRLDFLPHPREGGVKNCPPSIPYRVVETRTPQGASSEEKSPYIDQCGRILGCMAPLVLLGSKPGRSAFSFICVEPRKWLFVCLSGGVPMLCRTEYRCSEPYHGHIPSWSFQKVRRGLPP